MKLHIGCGKRNFGNGWIHIDGGNFPHVESNNIEILPFEDNSVALLYASHVIEYFDRVEVKKVLAEWYRVIKPGGIIRLAVPDFEQMVNLYNKKMVTLSDILGPMYGKMPLGDKTIYHKTVYDYSDLQQLLYNVGFINAKKWEWRNTIHAQYDDHSQAYIPHMKKNSGTLISLNMEATK